MKKVFFLFGFFALLTLGGNSQTILDGAYVKEHIRTKKVVPYPSIREADVLWSKKYGVLSIYAKNLITRFIILFRQLRTE